MHETPDAMAFRQRPALRGPSVARRVTVVEADGGVRRRRDRVATEEPLEIRANGPGEPTVEVAVTMRTPGDDFELAAGFLHGEGLLEHADEIDTIRYCADVERAEQEYNVLTVELRRPFDAEGLRRNFYATSSCGVCGKASIDQVQLRCSALPAGPVVGRDVVASLPEALRERQRIFEATGGLHAAALFTPEGQLIAVREDVGRHNAMDKLIGERLLARTTPLHDSIVLVSGRASFELVQKAAVAGIPILCAVSAPSSLAIETAQAVGMTLVGFLREDRFTIYTHPERVATA
jgi:FdhD protein